MVCCERAGSGAIWIALALLILGGCSDDDGTDDGSAAARDASAVDGTASGDATGGARDGGSGAATRSGAGGGEQGGGTAPRPPMELADGVLPPHDSAGMRPAPVDAIDAWVSYGNGPSNWFANLGERALGPDNVVNLELKWTIESEVTAPPVVYGSRVFVTTAADGFYAFDLEDGTELWHAESVSSFSAPAYDPQTDTVYVNRWEGGVMHAFDASDGELLWSMPIDEQDAVRGWSSPVVAADSLVVGIASSDRGTSFKGGLAAFDLSLGERRWAYIHAEQDAAGVAIWAGPSVDLDAQVAFAASGNNYTLAGGHSDSLFGVDLAAAELLWNQQTEADDRWAYDCIVCGPDHDFGTNPILIDYDGRELLAAGQKSGSFWLLDRTSGEVLWEKPVASQSHPAYGGVLNNGAFDGTRIIVAGNEGSGPGTLFALDPDPDGDGRVIWERPLDGLVMAPITVASGLAFVPVGQKLEIVSGETGETLAELPADAPVAGAAAVARGHVLFGSGLSYYDDGAQPGAFHVYGLSEGGGDGVGVAGDDPAPLADGGTGAGGGGDEPTFTRVFEEIIVGTGCNGGPLCHGGMVGGLQMTDRDATYAALVDVGAMGTNLADADNPDCVDTDFVRVVPGDPEASLLLQKIDPTGGQVPCGERMPPTGMLESEQIELVRAWIEAGARDD
jgi:polyvinyl alcohol dehydrogenase (cytochrome)